MKAFPATRTAYRTLLAFTTLVACTLAAHRPVSAQLPEGRFVRDVQAGDDLERVISDGLPKIKSTLAKIFKSKAKSRLRQVVVAAAWQQFTSVGDEVRLETDAWSGSRGITVKPGDAVRGWHRYWPNGKTEKLDVFTSMSGNTITYRYVAEDGQRTDTYSIDPTGTLLTQRIRLESDKLSSPIEYRLVFRRDRSEP